MASLYSLAMSRVFVPKEHREGESRVAVTPETAKRLIQSGFEVWVESGAGAASYLEDGEYAKVGAQITTDVASAWASADVVTKVTPVAEHPTLGQQEAFLIREGALLLCLMAPHNNADAVKTLAARRVSTLALELVPRISRAQSMDVLSSQANIAGYKAVLLAAAHLPRYFPLLMTAAGTIQPARVVVMGAGVAGLQAVATARRLGGVVEVSDIRPAVKEQVESLGAKFIELPEVDGEGEGGYAKELTPEFLSKQRAIVHARVVQADAVVTTALIPGRPAPRLVTAAMVEGMKPGSVVVDLAVEQGGNCELSEAGKTVVKHGVTLFGESNLAATLPTDASRVFSRNVQALLLHTAKDGTVTIDLEDEITQGTLLTHAGEVTHVPTRLSIEGGAA